MPFIEVQLLAGRTAEQREAFAAAVTEAAEEHLDTEAARVRIRFTDIEPGYLARGGRLVYPSTE